MSIQDAVKELVLKLAELSEEELDSWLCGYECARLLAKNAADVQIEASRISLALRLAGEDIREGLETLGKLTKAVAP